MEQQNFVQIKLLRLQIILREKNIKLSVVRYGNVFASRGSVVPRFLNLKDNYFPVTHKDMTRFNISLQDAIKLVIWTLKYSYGGEVVVPRIPSYRLIDLVKAINSKPKIKYVGIRLGEKLHEEMISFNESRHTISLRNKYIILPEYDLNKSKKFYRKFKDYKEISKPFNYNSNQKKFLSINNLKKLIRKFQSK